MKRVCCKMAYRFAEEYKVSKREHISAISLLCVDVLLHSGWPAQAIKPCCFPEEKAIRFPYKMNPCFNSAKTRL